MERLSVAPFSIRRVKLSSDRNGFDMDNQLAKKVSGYTLDQLQSNGRLFIADHLDQANQDLQGTGEFGNKYGAACQAYFYTDDRGQLRPLAIKPNVEKSNLVYTPLDHANDWMLAKQMFNQNDIWFTQWYHLAACHLTSEIVYLAAIRTLSEDHPLMIMLRRSECSDPTRTS